MFVKYKGKTDHPIEDASGKVLLTIKPRVVTEVDDDLGKKLITKRIEIGDNPEPKKALAEALPGKKIKRLPTGNLYYEEPDDLFEEVEDSKKVQEEAKKAKEKAEAEVKRVKDLETGEKDLEAREKAFKAKEAAFNAKEAKEKKASGQGSTPNSKSGK